MEGLYLMGNLKTCISLTLAGTLLLSPLGNVMQAQEFESELLQQNVVEPLQNYQIEDEQYGVLDVKTFIEEDKVTTSVYSKEELISKSIVYKTDGKVEEYDELGNMQVFHIQDFIENIDVNELKTITDIPTVLEEDNNLPIETYSYKVPNGYNSFKSEYSSVWKQSGTLYKKTDVSYGKEYKFEFSIGTKFSTAASVLSIIGKFDIKATLLTIGISVVGALIDTYANGTYTTRYLTDNFIVVSQGQHGLTTYQTGVDAYVYNSTNGAKSIERMRVEGDSRSHSDIIHAGIYNF